MSLEKVILIAAILSTLVPVVAVFIRGLSRRIMIVATLVAAIAVSFHLVVLIRLVEIGPEQSSRPWVYALVISTLPMLLAGYLLAICFGRDRPEVAFRDSRRTFILVGFIGAALLMALRHGTFLVAYDWTDGRGTIHLGSLGKAYLSYLLIGIVVVGYNLEKTYRIAPIDVRYRIRLPMVGLFGLLGFFTFILATGMLYSSIGMGKLVAAGLPITLASVAVAYGYLRGAITDVTAPVSRSIVYSSFTAMAAALFVLAIGAAAQIGTLTNWSPDEILIVTFAFLAILIAILLLLSNRFQRSVRRYIDRNFYVNRYDYRTQWSKLTSLLETAADREGVLDRTMSFLHDVFAPDEITLALLEDASSEVRPVRGKGSADRSESLSPESPLYRRLSQERKTILLDRSAHDFTYIAIYAENDRWLDLTASQMIAPLVVVDKLVGTIGLERKDEHDRFTFEDVTLMDSISTHVAAALRSIQLARELAETREIEVMSQWSSMLVHDLKNNLTPLRMAARNIVEYKDNADVIVECASDIDRVAVRMEKLVHTLSQLRENPQLGMEPISANDFIRETLTEMQIAKRTSVAVELRLGANQWICGDRGMLRRVLENLVVNALEAMNGGGRLSIVTRDHKGGEGPRVQIEVEDTGEGISDTFLREGLFRPFATTKRKGLGLGLYQCRAIVRAHDGDLTVNTELGKGSVFRISLPGIAPRLDEAGASGFSGRAREARG